MNNYLPESRDSKAQPTHEEIAAAAYQLYVQGGCREGDDWGDWLEAEKLLDPALPDVVLETDDEVEDLWWTEPFINSPAAHASVPAHSRKIEDSWTIRRPVERVFA